MAEDKGNEGSGAKPEGKPEGSDDGQAAAKALAAERKRANEAENQLKALRVEMAKVKSDSDASKSDQEKLMERIEAAEKKATEAEARQMRAEVVAAKRLTPAQAKRLQGGTREELEADADELIAAWGGPKGDDEGKGKGDEGKKDGGGEAAGARSILGARPKERLTAGAVPGATGDKSPAELAESILKSDF